MISKVYNKDCMIDMPKFKDNEFDLAIVDPPYGKGNENQTFSDKENRFGGWFDKYKKEIDINWDIAPTDKYFKELRRIAKHSIIWGGTISICHHLKILSYGVKKQLAKISAWQCVNMHGRT